MSVTVFSCSVVPSFGAPMNVRVLSRLISTRLWGGSATQLWAKVDFPDAGSPRVIIIVCGRFRGMRRCVLA